MSLILITYLAFYYTLLNPMDSKLQMFKYFQIYVLSNVHSHNRTQLSCQYTSYDMIKGTYKYGIITKYGC